MSTATRRASHARGALGTEFVGRLISAIHRSQAVNHVWIRKRMAGRDDGHAGTNGRVLSAFLFQSRTRGAVQRSSHSGAQAGVRFIKKNFPRMPFGYLFITIARWARWGTRTGARSE